VGDDYFGAPLTPSDPGPPVSPVQADVPAAFPQMSPQPAPSAMSFTVGGSVVAAWGGVIAALFMGLGALSPWLRIHGAGDDIEFGGLHSQLDGKWVLILAVVTLAGAVTPLALPPGSAARRYAAAGMAVAGLIALIVIVREFVVLSNRATAIDQDFATFVGLHVGSGWGLWQAGVGSAGALAAGIAGYLLDGGRSPTE
jgi:hypothetical protein